MKKLKISVKKIELISFRTKDAWIEKLKRSKNGKAECRLMC